MLNDYDRLTSRDDTPELVVFHLMGQHVSYSDRYPKEEARFTDRDAIAVYLSDHGEEVYDYRDFFCRSHDLPLTPEVCKYQFEIPFMIWMSDTYRRNRPDVAAQVAGALDRPFSADDLSHLLLDLAGIRCRWYDPAPPTAADGVRTRRKLRDHHRTRPKTIRLCHYPALDFHIFSYLCQR